MFSSISARIYTMMFATIVIVLIFDIQYRQHRIYNNVKGNIIMYIHIINKSLIYTMYILFFICIYNIL